MPPHILAKRHLHVLNAFGSSNVLLAFDYDGTLAPLVADRRMVRMRPVTRRLLASVARRYPCAVISGRGLDDLGRQMQGVPVLHLSGNHGLEPWAPHARYRTQVRGWVREMRRHVATEPGVVIEDKMYSLTVHYRHARRPRQALAAIRRAVHTLRGARSLGGIYAVSLVPRGAPTKGVALERTRELFGCDQAIFIGDDETDEDVFTLSGAGAHLLTIRVGLRRGSRANFQLRDQREVDDLLRALLACRPIHRQSGGHGGAG